MLKMKAMIAWLFFLIILSKGSTAQQYDKVWALGSPVTTMAFEGDSIELGYLDDTINLSFVTMASMCDANGNFLFYSNGLAVYNRYGNIMPYGDSLSFPSEYYSLEEPFGEASNEGLIILPKPNNANQYYLFHYISTDTDLVVGGYEALNFYYSVVDMTLDSGRGDLVVKNVPLIQNELLSGSRLAACKHANGRDWWIVKPAWHKNIYYTFLLTPDSIEGPFIQQIGPIYGADEEVPGGYSAFSPDGSKYVSVTPVSYVVLMDFDRCTGLFSNPDSFYNNCSTDPINSPNSGGGSIAFSPSGRFLYVDIPAELNQYDLWSSHPHDSVRIETDTGEFYQMGTMQLAPNGKIYLSCWAGGAYAIHVINQPDSLGLACDFHLFQQPVLSVNSSNLPYFPNFRLGALVGSGCDTISGISPQTPEGGLVSVYPNPASTHAEIIYNLNKNSSSMAELYDIEDRLLWSKTVSNSAGSIFIDLTAIPAGVYIVRFTSDGQSLLNSKLVVCK